MILRSRASASWISPTSSPDPSAPSCWPMPAPRASKSSPPSAKAPRARHGGVALVAAAESTVLNGRRNVHGTPMQFGFPLGDLRGGLAAYGAIVTALFERNRTGIGQHVTIALVRNLFAMTSTNV